jgi:hypothetical protein
MIFQVQASPLRISPPPFLKLLYPSHPLHKLKKSDQPLHMNAALRQLPLQKLREVTAYLNALNEEQVNDVSKNDTHADQPALAPIRLVE